MSYMYRIFILLFGASLFLSCSEDEKDFDSSPDLLIRVSKPYTLVMDLYSENTNEQKELQKAIEESLKDYNVYFQQDYVYEIKLDKNKSFDGYKSKADYDKGIKYIEGTYAFNNNDELKEITFTVENIQTTLILGGSLADMICNHFTRQDGGGSYHILQGGSAFCLNDDMTEKFKEEFGSDYPGVEIKQVFVKTDVMTLRPLETFK